jgi:hypothetical protein
MREGSEVQGCPFRAEGISTIFCQPLNAEHGTFTGKGVMKGEEIKRFDFLISRDVRKCFVNAENLTAKF